MSRKSRLRDSLVLIHQTLDALDERTEVLERFLAVEGIDKVRAQVVRERQERKRREAELRMLGREREKLMQKIDWILEARSILEEYFDIEVVEIDGRIFEVRDGEYIHPSVPYGILALDNKAKHAGVGCVSGLMDRDLKEKKLAEWDRTFDPKELEDLKARINEFSTEELNKLQGELGARSDSFQSKLPDRDGASDDEEG